MNDNILKQRWEAVDKLLSTHFVDNRKLTRELKDNIQEIFYEINFGYEELVDYATTTTLSYFRRRATRFLELEGISEYTNYLIKKYVNKKKLLNKDICLALILMEYEKKQIKLNEKEFDLFNNIAEVSYNQGQEDAMEVLGNRKYKPFPHPFLLMLLAMPSYRGYVWKDYVEGNVVYNAKQIYTQMVLNIQQNRGLNIDDDIFDEIFSKQDKRYLNKKTFDSIDKYSGSLDNYVVYLTNSCALEGMKRQGVKKVRFIATKDEKTTDMCGSLDNQVFDIDGWNKYSRYSKDDDANIIYTTYGLKQGENLPPIENGYHHCRSTIYPERN